LSGEGAFGTFGRALPDPASNVSRVTKASEPAFLVLHALRLKGFADTPVVADRAGIEAVDAQTLLEKAVAAGFVTRRDGRISGWALTHDGRARHAELIADELAAAGVRPQLEQAYHGFLGVNNELLTVCTDWQLRSGGLNDHNDAEYDASVVERLGAVDAQVQPVCGDLAAALDRFCDYGPRLASALERVRDGQRDWFAKPMIDSYHTVWFELHEDLLATLGIERSKEG
jgi:hypothetical protein